MTQLLSDDAAMDMLRCVIPKEHSISITTFDYRHIREIRIVSGFELAKGKVLTETLVRRAIREWRTLTGDNSNGS
jgi:hypothetical protein